MIWIVNHQALLKSEVPIIRSLGWEVFIPKKFPLNDPGYRSAATTYEHDEPLRLGPAELRVLNEHDFYNDVWSATVADTINRHFDVIVASYSAYIYPLSESARKFKGKLLARVFGREHPITYSGLLPHFSRPNLLEEVERMGKRFIFAQSFDNMAEREDARLRKNAFTITVPIPDWAYAFENKWTGKGSKAIFLTPSATDGGYNEEIYRRVKTHFGDLPHLLFGSQLSKMDDSNILTYLTDDELAALYINAPVFPYPHREPIHLHYSPLEAMLMGTPVLYLKDSQLDKLAGQTENPASCQDEREMREKTVAILGGNRELAEQVRLVRKDILATCSYRAATSQWDEILNLHNCGNDP